jgi:hypothetical protein
MSNLHQIRRRTRRRTPRSTLSSGLASVNEWSFERDEDDEISIVVSGRWTDYTVAFTWLPDVEALHISCAFDLKVAGPPAAPRAAELATLVNEHLWVGHFDLWPSRGVACSATPCCWPAASSRRAPVRHACCEAAHRGLRAHYQAFQFVAWAGRSAREALDATMFETVGEA